MIVLTSPVCRLVQELTATLVLALGIALGIIGVWWCGSREHRN